MDGHVLLFLSFVWHFLQVNNTINPSPHNKECYLYAVDSQASVVFVSIQYAVPPESATVWTKAVFQVIQPSRHISVPYTHFFLTLNECLLTISRHRLVLRSTRLVDACCQCLYNPLTAFS
jgi:hypothetical protein